MKGSLNPPPQGVASHRLRTTALDAILGTLSVMKTNTANKAGIFSQNSTLTGIIESLFYAGLEHGP